MYETHIKTAKIIQTWQLKNTSRTNTMLSCVCEAAGARGGGRPPWKALRHMLENARASGPTDYRGRERGDGLLFVCAWKLLLSSFQPSLVSSESFSLSFARV